MLLLTISLSMNANSKWTKRRGIRTYSTENGKKTKIKEICLRNHSSRRSKKKLKLIKPSILQLYWTLLGKTECSLKNKEYKYKILSKNSKTTQKNLRRNNWTTLCTWWLNKMCKCPKSSKMTTNWVRTSGWIASTYHTPRRAGRLSWSSRRRGRHSSTRATLISLSNV